MTTFTGPGPLDVQNAWVGKNALQNGPFVLLTQATGNIKPGLGLKPKPGTP